MAGWRDADGGGGGGGGGCELEKCAFVVVCLVLTGKEQLCVRSRAETAPAPLPISFSLLILSHPQ